jgi:hypothetical protein
MKPARHLLLPLVVLALAAPAPASAVAQEASSCAAATYVPAEQPPFGGAPVPALRAVDGGEAPDGYRRTVAEAIAIADDAPEVVDELAESPDAEARAFTQGPCRWQVSYLADGAEVARVAVDDEAGIVLEAWGDHQVGSELARGYEGAVAQKVNAPYVWLPLCLLFILPFLDPRRLLRTLHLDLAVILALGISLFFFNRGEITTSVPLTYPVLAYVLARGLWIGLRPRQAGGALVPLIPIRWLAIAAVALAVGRIALNVADSQVIDVGVAGVIGADQIGGGTELYAGGFSQGLDLRGDVYGPANYLAYVPFEAVFGWDGTWGDVPAAHAASIAFDLLTAIGLFVLGRRLRSGVEGRGLGVALAYAWLACPFTLYTLNANANDALIAATVVGALLVAASPAARGAMIALGAAAKFGTAALGPLFATAGGERRLRSTIVFSLAFAAVAVAVLVPFLPDGGASEVYDRTLGYQASRGSPFSIWGLAPSLDWLEPVARAAGVALAVAVAFVPRRKTVIQLAALAAAVIVAVQLGAGHWFYFYVAWFLPPFLVAAFAPYRGAPRHGA